MLWFISSDLFFVKQSGYTLATSLFRLTYWCSPKVCRLLINEIKLYQSLRWETALTCLPLQISKCGYTLATSLYRLTKWLQCQCSPKVSRLQRKLNEIVPDPQVSFVLVKLTPFKKIKNLSHYLSDKVYSYLRVARCNENKTWRNCWCCVNDHAQRVLTAFETFLQKLIIDLYLPINSNNGIGEMLRLLFHERCMPFRLYEVGDKLRDNRNKSSHSPPQTINPDQFRSFIDDIFSIIIYYYGDELVMSYQRLKLKSFIKSCINLN